PPATAPIDSQRKTSRRSIVAPLLKDAADSSTESYRSKQKCGRRWAVRRGQQSAAAERAPNGTSAHCRLPTADCIRDRICTMKSIKTMGAVLVLAMVAPSSAQVFTFSWEQMIKYTANTPY